MASLQQTISGIPSSFKSPTNGMFNNDTSVDDIFSISIPHTVSGGEL
jgi:hypothetical protein